MLSNIGTHQNLSNDLSTIHQTNHQKHLTNIIRILQPTSFATHFSHIFPTTLGPIHHFPTYPALHQRHPRWHLWLPASGGRTVGAPLAQLEDPHRCASGLAVGM